MRNYSTTTSIIITLPRFGHNTTPQHHMYITTTLLPHLLTNINAIYIAYVGMLFTLNIYIYYICCVYATIYYVHLHNAFIMHT